MQNSVNVGKAEKGGRGTHMLKTRLAKLVKVGVSFFLAVTHQGGSVVGP